MTELEQLVDAPEVWTPEERDREEWCANCGQPLSAPACSMTHAILANELMIENREKEA